MWSDIRGDAGCGRPHRDSVLALFSRRGIETIRVRQSRIRFFCRDEFVFLLLTCVFESGRSINNAVNKQVVLLLLRWINNEGLISVLGDVV